VRPPGYGRQADFPVNFGLDQLARLNARQQRRVLRHHGAAKPGPDKCLDPNFALVDNARYTYAFNICLDPGSVFFNARLGYSYTSAGD
jgi:hypothetical protein